MLHLVDLLLLSADDLAAEFLELCIRNAGTEDHEFLLATTEDNLKHAEAMKKNLRMEHDDPNGVRLAPKKSAEILWKFTKTGTFEYSCLIPDHREYGMIGKVTVKEPGKTGERKKP